MLGILCGSRPAIIGTILEITDVQAPGIDDSIGTIFFTALRTDILASVGEDGGPGTVVRGVPILKAREQNLPPSYVLARYSYF